MGVEDDDGHPTNTRHSPEARHFFSPDRASRFVSQPGDLIRTSVPDRPSELGLVPKQTALARLAAIESGTEPGTIRPPMAIASGNWKCPELSGRDYWIAAVPMENLLSIATDIHTDLVARLVEDVSLMELPTIVVADGAHIAVSGIESITARKLLGDQDVVARVFSIH